MSGVIVGPNGEYRRAPECPPGAHDALWVNTPSGGVTMRCDSCLTIVVCSREGLERLHKLIEVGE